MEVSRTEGELPDKLASLDIVDAEPPTAGAAGERVLRKRKSSQCDTNTSCPPPRTNRRVRAAPRKRLAADMCSPEEIEALYLNKKVKTSSQALETISEEPASAITLIGGRKVKRHLNFQIGGHFTKEKIKKRRSKIKKLLSNRFLNRKKIPMKTFLQTIQCLELDDFNHTDSVTDSTHTQPVPLLLTNASVCVPTLQ